MNEPPRWIEAGELAALRFDPGAVVVVEGIEVAVFPLGDGYTALVNSCPHAGGPLASGIRDGDRIECPWHGWSFELATGACIPVPSRPARRLPVRVVDGRLSIGLPAAC